MNTELQRRFDGIEGQRAFLQSGVLALSDTQLNWTPNAAAWSISQIVQHLVLSDETVGLARDKDRMELESLMFRLVPRAWRRALVLRALKRNVALPLPSPAVEPNGAVPLAELLARWDRVRREMRGVLEVSQGAERRYSHPVLGPLTSVQMLDLAQTHIAYHMRQMEALQSDADYPSKG